MKLLTGYVLNTGCCMINGSVTVEGNVKESNQMACGQDMY